MGEIAARPPAPRARERSGWCGSLARGYRDFMERCGSRYTPGVSSRSRLVLAGLFAALAAVVLFTFARSRDRAAETGAARGPAEPLVALGEASGWIASPLPVDSLRGRVVVLIVWSDTEPLSLRLLREAEAWQQAYGRFGLRVVGVHEPEFAFSADSAAPASALRRLGVRLPVALDAGSRVGSRLGVGDRLPLWIVVGPDGRSVRTAEGDRAEEVLLAAIGALRRTPGGAGLEPLPAAPEAATHAPTVARRVYCGVSRVAGGPLANASPGGAQTFTVQFRFQEQGVAYTPYPVGRWTPSADGVTSARGGAADYLAIRYDGGRVDAVLGAREPARVWVMCDDGWLPAAERGGDVRVDARGATFVEVEEPRPYAIVRGGGAHLLRLSPEAPGVTYYVFSFESD